MCQTLDIVCYHIYGICSALLQEHNLSQTRVYLSNVPNTLYMQNMCNLNVAMTCSSNSYFTNSVNALAVTRSEICLVMKVRIT